MIGAIAGDIIGSVFEFDPIKTKDFPLFSAHSRFTDDSVLTIAVARAIMDDRDYRRALWELGGEYPNAGFGGMFYRWLNSHDPQPYNSLGNGAAMRVSPVGFAFETVDQVLQQAERTAEVSHNHPEGVKGAQATALAIFLARTARDKDLIRAEITDRFGYDLDRSTDEIRPSYTFDVTCPGTVPEAIIAFLESDSYEDAVRTAVSLGGDSDTLGCITGGIAQAYYGSVPADICSEVREYLSDELWSITERFCNRYLTE
ncbi:MAG: ADP-ribosylglycohydrolase family protein [Phycisphaerae bacterium]|jgi:ADP-ribosylglycohydrolase|nr:ADP-ribosylglycohydrolase family protein [Phycisphaerae bacterium]